MKEEWNSSTEQEGKITQFIDKIIKIETLGYYSEMLTVVGSCVFV